MGPLATQLVLESLIAPGFVAILAMLSTRGVDRSLFQEVAPAIAIILALGITYLLAFGWPGSSITGARSKIALSGGIGFGLGLAIQRNGRASKAVLTLAGAGIPLWVGLPALQQGRLNAAWLILPIAAVFLATLRMNNSARPSGMSHLIIFMTLAFSFAAIAFLAKALSFAQLSLAVGNALLAILIIDRQALTIPAAAVAAAILLALMTALLLYTEASAAALVILVVVVSADHLAMLLRPAGSVQAPLGLVSIFCALPAITAIVVARIDAGAVSFY